jgi:hypothetical protein
VSFESHIVDTLKDLEKKRRDAVWRQGNLLHDCDCDYCDRSGEVEEESEDEWRKIGKDIIDIDKTIKSLKGHAHLYKIKIPQEVK